MTSLTVTPNVEKKTLKLAGRIAAGEKVDLVVKTFDDKAAEGRHLRVRLVSGKTTVAAFPAEDGDAWDTGGGDARCVLNVDTVQAEKLLRCGGVTLLVVDDPDADTLYCMGECPVLPWPKELGEDVPYDLSAYPDNIAAFEERLDAAEGAMALAASDASYAKSKAEEALVEASGASVSANEAATDAENARGAADEAQHQAGLASRSAESSAESARAAEDAANRAEGYIGQIADGKQDKLSDEQMAVVNSGKTSIPTSGSSMLITSGGVFDVVRGIIDTTQEKLTAGRNITISGNVIGASGVTSYNELTDFPKINGNDLYGNKTAANLGLQAKLTAGDNISIVGNVISATGGGSSVVESDSNPGYAANADVAESAHEAARASSAVEAEHAESVPWVGIEGKPNVATEEQVDTVKTELNARIDRVEATAHPNMNVVGSPMFSQGSVSGFSANDYLVFPTEVNVGQNNVEFDIAFTTGPNVTTQQNVLDSWCGLALAVQNGHMVLAASSNGTSFVTENGSHSVVPNTAYRYRIGFSYYEGSYQFVLQIADGHGGYSLDAGFSMDAPLFPTATYWGGANPKNGIHHIFGGSINLGECRITWNGRQVWSGFGAPDVVRYNPTAEDPLDTAEKIAAQSAYPMVDVVGGALKDRAVNHATNGGTFAFPERTGSNARDFVLAIDAQRTAPTVTFPAGVTYISDQDASAVWTAEANKFNAWYFSEQTDGVFMVCHKSMPVISQ